MSTIRIKSGASFSRLAHPTRPEIKLWCKQPYTIAMAWALYTFRDEPAMPTLELCRYLDECGTASPIRNLKWEHYYENEPGKMRSMVANLRNLLGDKGVNHNPPERAYLSMASVPQKR